MDNKRFEFIEKGTLLAAKEVDQHYRTFIQEINEENERYTREKLPPLFNLLQQYEDNPTAKELFAKKIDCDMSLQIESTKQQINAALNSRDMLLLSISNTKSKILDQTAAIEGRFAEGLAFEYNQVNGRIAGTGMSSANGGELPGVPVAGALPGGKMS